MTTSRSKCVALLCLARVCFTHRPFSQTAKIGSLVDIQDSEDPEGLRVFYYLVQDLKVRRLRLLPEMSSLNRSSPTPTVPHFLLDLTALQNQAHMIVDFSRLPVLLA